MDGMYDYLSHRIKTESVLALRSDLEEHEYDTDAQMFDVPDPYDKNQSCNVSNMTESRTFAYLQQCIHFRRCKYDIHLLFACQ